MNNLILLLDEFWRWTGLFKDKWWNVDINDLPLDSTQFDYSGEICNECIKLINTPMSGEEIRYFLMGLAINSEDEDILEAMKMSASDKFLVDILSVGISYPQADARWQLCELLRRDIPDRDYFLNILINDSDEYVVRRARSVLSDILQNNKL